ncbi:hypothetical protein O3M35_011355 [Rhynocoris fuscipes]
MQLQIKSSDLKMIFSLKVKMNDVKFLKRSYKKMGITHVKFLQCNRATAKTKPKKPPETTTVKITKKPKKVVIKTTESNVKSFHCPKSKCCNCKKWFSRKKKVRVEEDKTLRCACGRPLPRRKSLCCL